MQLTRDARRRQQSDRWSEQRGRNVRDHPPSTGLAYALSPAYGFVWGAVHGIDGSTWQLDRRVDLDETGKKMGANP